jgi:uncharacterized protein YdeI (YjbR/CyaY-like superfamily)
MDELLQFKNRAGWRAWLAENHSKSKGTWLAISKKHAKNAALSYEEAVEEALCFGWIDSIVKKRDVETFQQWFAPRRENSIWSVSNKRRAEKLMAEGKMTHAGMAKIEAAKRSGSWQQALGTPTELVPEDFQKELGSNEKAKRFFASLTKTDRYFYVYWIASSKKPATRQERILKAIDRLAHGKRLTQE